jgi:hypothetical protein
VRQQDFTTGDLLLRLFHVGDAAESGAPGRRCWRVVSLLRAKYARNPVCADTMPPGKPCIDCRTLIDSSVLNEPHISLKTYVVNVLPDGNAEYYECRACGAKLLREKKEYAPAMRWRLV